MTVSTDPTPAQFPAAARTPVNAEPGRFLDADTFRIERRLPGSIERVWSYLVEPDKRSQWLGTGTIEPRVGGAVHLRFHNLDLSPIKEPAPDKHKKVENSGSLHGEVVRFEPPRLLSLTWGDPQKNPSIATFELTPHEGETLLVVTHSRLRMGERTDVAGGWHTHLAILLDHLEGVTPRPFWRTHAAVEPEYESRLPRG